MIFPLRLRALLVSNSLLIHPVAKNGPRPLSLTRKNAKGPAMFWGHSQNFVFGILRSLELRTQITQFLDTCWIFFDVRLMLVDFSCKPSLAFCVWDSLHAAAGRIRLHISKFLAELGLAAMEFLQQMALCIEQHIFEYILIHSLIHIWCILFDSKIYLKNMICIHIYIHIQYIYILMILSDATASTQNQVMLALMSLEMAIPAIPAIPADARSVSARASVGWSRLRQCGGRLPREQLGDGVEGPYWNLGTGLKLDISRIEMGWQSPMTLPYFSGEWNTLSTGMYNYVYIYV